jgi:hypothetical protein
MVASGVAVLLLRRLGFRPLLMVGFVVQAVGLVMVALPSDALRPDLWLALATGIAGWGWACRRPRPAMQPCISRRITSPRWPGCVLPASELVSTVRDVASCLFACIIADSSNRAPEPTAGSRS